MTTAPAVPEPGDADPDDDFDPETGFDLDAEVALQLEAEHKPIQVRMGGRVIPFPQMSMWPWEAVEYLQSGSLIECLEILFPVEDDDIKESVRPARITDGELRSIKAQNEKTLDFFRDVPTGALRRLFEHFQAKSDVSPGNSNRSERRSRRTRRR